MNTASLSHPIRRVLSILMVLVLVATTAVIPVSADMHNHGTVNLDKTYGQEIDIAVRGTCEYAIAYDLLDLMNAERKKVGKSALVMDKAMMEAAMQRAAEVSIYNAHSRPNGTEWYTALPTYATAGENIAAGFASAEQVMEGWMASPLHKANILDSDNYGFRSAGIGVFQIDGVYYWTQEFNSIEKKSKPTQKKAVTKTFTIKARTKLLDLNINKTALTLDDGETETLTVTNRNVGYAYYDHPLHYSGLSFSTKNSKVAMVSSSGKVASAGVGTTSILVKSDNGVTLFTVPVTARCSTINVTVSNVSSGAKVSWNKVTDATSYKVYKSVYKSGKWSSYTTLKTTKSTTITDSISSGSKAKYLVYPYAGSKKMNTHDTAITLYLSQPKVKVTNASNGAKVSWGKVTGATSYKVYRSTYSGGKWTSYTLYKTTTSTTYTNTSVKSGQKVRYTVYAYKSGYKSATKTGVATIYLSRPSVKLTKATKGVKVSWGKISGATSYKVYKSVYKNGKWSSYTVCKTSKTTSYTDSAIKKGQKVRYIVYAYNGSYKSAAKTGVSITR